MELEIINSGLANCLELFQNTTKFFQCLQCVLSRELRGYSDWAVG